MQALARPLVHEEEATRRVTLYFVVTGFLALLIGVAIGPLQAFNYADLNLYPFLRPILQSYYQGLTIHAVMNAYAFPFFVISGLLIYLSAKELGLTPSLRLTWASYLIMLVGLLSVAYAMFDDSSNVLYTFYPPLKGSPFFYLGITLLVVGSLVPLWVILEMRARWHRLHPGQVTPLVTFMSAATLLMWLLAAIGAAVEALFLLDPWSLGLVHGINPLLARTLFWWTGHPIVYYWLLPAYISWYALVPGQAGGKLLSGPLARLAFILLLIFSVPVGIHHQFADAGISPLIKGIVTGLTLSVAIPSLITAFTLASSLEYAGRLRGGRGWFGWIKKLPWNDPSVVAQLLAMITFIFGGASGIVNGSWQLDNVVHNTTWIPGHFHITLGTATALSFMGISFWLLPHLTGRRLYHKGIALGAVWLWFVGMLTFSLGMGWSGLLGVPRRDWISSLPHSVFHFLYGDARVPLTLVGLGGTILLISAILYYWVFFGTLLVAPRQAQRPEVPFAEAVSEGEGTGFVRVLDRLGAWTLFTFVLVLLIYVPTLWVIVHHPVIAHGVNPF
jgi:cytochrome c oxidase subunit 1